MKLDFSLIKSIYHVGVESIIMMALGSVLNFSMNAILISSISTAIVTFGIYFKLQIFACIIIFGLNNGMVVLFLIIVVLKDSV